MLRIEDQIENSTAMIKTVDYIESQIRKINPDEGTADAFVAEAKKQVFGMVSIDMIAGPSEILVIADGKSDPRFVAADLLFISSAITIHSVANKELSGSGPILSSI